MLSNIITKCFAGLYIYIYIYIPDFGVRVKWLLVYHNAERPASVNADFYCVLPCIFRFSDFLFICACVLQDCTLNILLHAHYNKYHWKASNCFYYNCALKVAFTYHLLPLSDFIHYYDDALLLFNLIIIYALFHTSTICYSALSSNSSQVILYLIMTTYKWKQRIKNATNFPLYVLCNCFLINNLILSKIISTITICDSILIMQLNAIELLL